MSRWGNRPDRKRKRGRRRRRRRRRTEYPER
jgi:hypothetical protein